MPLEVEAKFRVDSHDAVRTRLEQAGAARIGRVLERNHIFDKVDRSLLVGDRGLRVREYVILDGPARDAVLTYKGQRLGGELKTRQEIETAVGNAAAMMELLTSVGFVEAVTFEKRRESWKLGPCHIDLDELPHLGLFIEIEGSDEDAVREAQNALGLHDARHVRSSYIALLVEYCHEHGLPTDRITFP